MAELAVALAREQGRARHLKNFLAPEHHDFRQVVNDNGHFWEGYRPFVYDAGDGKDTVGYGLNLTDNPNAAKYLRAVNLDIEKVRAGTQRVSELHARKLFELDMADRARAVAKNFNAEELAGIPNHAWEGILDLAYNANPQLFSDKRAPKMMAALKSGDLHAAAVEIATDTMGGPGKNGMMPEKLAPGVLARRYWQAAKVAGVRLNQLDQVIPGIPPYREMLERLYPGILERMSRTVIAAEARLG